MDEAGGRLEGVCADPAVAYAGSVPGQLRAQLHNAVDYRCKGKAEVSSYVNAPSAAKWADTWGL